MYSVYAELRDKQGLSDYAVAKGSGVGRSILSDWKTGKHIPNMDNLKKIANFFNVSLEYLITGHNAEYNVTDIEYMIIVAYREAPEYKKQAILDLLDIVMEVKKEALDA